VLLESERPAAERASVTITDFMEIQIPRSEAVEKPAPVQAVERAAEVSVEDIDSSAEQVEELMSLPEVLPLPPEPVEEGLELLPYAEEKESAARESEMTFLSDEIPGAPLDEAQEAEELIPIEDTTEAAASIAPFAVAQAPANPMTTLEPEVEDEVEEFESIDDEEETGPAPSNVYGRTEEKAELSQLLKNHIIRTWSLDDIQKMVEEGRSAIVMENGVFRIKDDVYASGGEAREGKADSELREIARDVVQHAAASEAAPAPHEHEDTGLGGIGDLISDADSIDLSKVVSADRSTAPEEPVSINREKLNPIRLKRNGLDYDELLSSYPRSFTHTTQMKSLVEVSRRVEAVSAALFLKKIEGYFVDLTVGLGEKTLSILNFDVNSPFYSDMLLARKVISVDKTPTEIRFLKSRFDPDDLRYMRHVLFIPTIFRGQEAYLFFAFSGETDIAMNAILVKLLTR
ncbi:MAG: hypothetical protein NTY16_07860, partial [Deltaproteobacteria bacterium]|nr:hypothetical protein [Deltaproteobacteria bacterium]